MCRQVSCYSKTRDNASSLVRQTLSHIYILVFGDFGRDRYVALMYKLKHTRLHVGGTTLAEIQSFVFAVGEQSKRFIVTFLY